MPKEKNFHTIILGLLVLAFGLLLCLIGYFVGNVVPLKNLASKKAEPASPLSSHVFAPTTTPVAEEESPEEPVEKPESTLSTKTINGYQKDFKFDYPEDWTVDIESTEFSTSVTIYKGEFKIYIAQGDMGSARCIYLDEPDYDDPPEGPQNKCVEFVEFQGLEGRFRRTQYPAQGQYTVCNKAIGYTTFSVYSPIGFITYRTPIYPSEEELKELDDIAASMEAL